MSALTPHVLSGEGFSAVAHACHLRDIEIDGYHTRITRMRTEIRPALPSIDGFALATQRHYATASAHDALSAFRAARQKTLTLLADLTPADLQRRGTFADYGELTLEALIHYLCSHDRQHLACLHYLLGRQTSL